MKSSSHVAFSESVKRVQQERGSRGTYGRVEQGGGLRTEVDDELRAFLADIDTAFLATASADGQPYVQHRGGERGFIKALDDETIGFIDLKGNRQYISTGNLNENDRVCLFLIDYATKRRVKIWGHARAVPLDDALLAKLDAGGAHPEQVMLIRVTQWDVNCPAHIPQKVDVNEVVDVVTELRSRIAALEAENARLRQKPTSA